MLNDDDQLTFYKSLSRVYRKIIGGIEVGFLLVGIDKYSDDGRLKKTAKPTKERDI